MQKYIATRLLLAAPTIVGVTVIIFVVMRVLPGDPLVAIMGMEGFRRLTPEQRASYMDELGLDDPLYVQYGRWVKEIASGSLGESFFRGDKVSDLIARRGAISAEIGVLGMVISWLVGVPVGIISAVRPNTMIDFGARMFALIFLAVPGFWVGMLIVLSLIIWFDYKSPIVPIQIWQDPWSNFQIVVGPAVVLGLGMSASISRMTRSSLFEVLREDYVRTARAKGLLESLVIVRHALPNAILPVITLSGIFLGFVLGGSVAIEQAFVIPGLGKSMVEAAVERDMIVVQNLVMLYAILFVTINLAVDISYGFLDPRVRQA